MGLFNLLKPAKSVVVVDGLALNAVAGLKGRVPPRNQLQVLRRLSRFAQREKVEVIAVLSGSPLNKAPQGKKFEEMEVRYSKSEEEHGKYLIKTAKSFGGRTVLVVGDELAEKEIGNSVRTMRMSTFRKAFDTGGLDGDEGDERTSERGERGERGERSGRERNRNRRRPRQDRQEREPRVQQEPHVEMVSEVDAINELIDLVD
jgi:hypothetical protein